MRGVFLAASVLLASTSTFAMTVSVTTSSKLPLYVGSPIEIIASVADPDPGSIVYRLSVARGNNPFEVVTDYNHYNSFVWTPSAQEGSYTFQVTANNLNTGEIVSASAVCTVLSRVVSGTPVISLNSNPLVALYSAPPCPVGSKMYVQFGSGQVVSHTNSRPCSGNTSMNFYIAGMLPGTTYNIHDVVITGGVSKPGPVGQFLTGIIPTSLMFPQSSLLIPAGAQTATSQSVLLMDELSIDSSYFGQYYFPNATDLNGNVIWYYSALGNPQQRADYSLRPVAGGTLILNAADPQSKLDRGQIWREIDLAGNIIRETNVTRVTAQLNAKGLLGIIDFDHDSIRLPNGHTLINCSQEEIFPAGTQGFPDPIDILGNAVVDLDTNLQVVWSWSAFEHLDVNRAPILGELCAPNTDGCPPMTLAPFAVDWTHANSLNYIPSSGDFLISIRNQDWIAKIDYQNGAGSGNVLWEMGIGGSFAINSQDPFPWFSHQHDAEYELGGTSILSLYDNGNTRLVENPEVTENSRGMVLNVDEVNMVVTPILSQDLGVFSGGVGSAQRLDNGNYFFTSGFVNQGAGDFAQHSEFTLGGTETFLIQENILTYRGYRMDSLYQLDGPGN